MLGLLLLLLQVLASCLWLGHSAVFNSSAGCPQFFYAQTPPNNAVHAQSPSWICQSYNNSVHYVTLYDKAERIPIYSAYIYQPGNGSRLTSWFVEPQLINQRYLKYMATESYIANRYNITSQQIGLNQAIDQDYRKLQGLNRGHLCPSLHRSGNNSKWATFTLTNIVPQNSTLNGGAWNYYENITMAQNTQNCTITYVITGVVPGNTYVPSGRVNVPSHIWSAACCQTNTNMTTWAVIADNTMNQVQSLTLAQLETMLSQHYKKGNVSLFHTDCPR